MYPPEYRYSLPTYSICNRIYFAAYLPKLSLIFLQVFRHLRIKFFISIPIYCYVFLYNTQEDNTVLPFHIPVNFISTIIFSENVYFGFIISQTVD